MDYYYYYFGIIIIGIIITGKYISWNLEKIPFLVKSYFSREKGKETEREKGQRARERRLKEGKA